MKLEIFVMKLTFTGTNYLIIFVGKIKLGLIIIKNIENWKYNHNTKFT